LSFSEFLSLLGDLVSKLDGEGDTLCRRLRSYLSVEDFMSGLEVFVNYNLQIFLFMLMITYAFKIIVVLVLSLKLAAASSASLTEKSFLG
jgi:hypothetical protein